MKRKSKEISNDLKKSYMAGFLKKIVRIENILLGSLLIYGSIFIFLVPPFQVPDELQHFFRSWSLAEGQLICTKDSNVTVPSGVASIEKGFDMEKVKNREKAFSFDMVRKKRAEMAVDTKDKVFTQFCAYNPVAYIPQAAGIKASMIFDKSPITAFYFARISNFLFAVTILYIAIRVIPFGKKIIFMVALLPMTLYQTSSLSCDALIISGVIFFTSVILYLSQQEKILSKHKLLLAVSSTFLYLKPGYYPFALLLFIIKPRQFKNKKEYLKYLVFILIINIMLAMFSYEFSKMSILLKPSELIQPAQQASLIYHSPYEFFRTISSTLGTQSIDYFRSMVGRLGLNDFYVKDIVVLLFIIGLLFVMTVRARDNNSTVNLSLFQRMLLICSAVLSFLTILFLEYLFWTPVGARLIEGIQGRYFIPLVPAFLVGIYKIQLSKLGINIVLTMLVVLILFLASYSIYLNFY